MPSRVASPAFRPLPGTPRARRPLRRRRAPPEEASARDAGGAGRPRTAWAWAAHPGPRDGRARGPRRGPGPLRLLGRRQPAGQGQQPAARPGRRQRDRAPGETGPHRTLGEHLAALQQSRRDRPGTQGAQGREVVGAGVVTRREGVLEEFQISGEGAGERVAVAGEIGEEEGAQPSRLAHHLVHRACQAQTVLDILFRQGRGVEGVGESTSEHPELVRAERHAAA